MNLAVESVSKSFPGVRALDGVSIELRGGEVHALMGENGAGKSTLVKILTGMLRPDSGRLWLDARPVAFRPPRDALRAGVSAVPQERNLIPRFSVGENILPERPPTRNGLVDRFELDRAARRFLEPLDFGIDVRAEARALSVAQMQIVEIARALAQESEVLVLDEPTASISEREAAALLTRPGRLRTNRAAIVFVSHRLDEVFAIADRITVLHDGKTVAQGAPTAEMNRQRLVSLMIRREEPVIQMREPRIDPNRIMLETSDLST